MAESVDEGSHVKSRLVEDAGATSTVGFELSDRLRVDSDKTCMEEEFQSLEYEEDCFYPVSGANPTPSFDEVSDEADSETTYWTLDPESYSADLQMSDASDAEDATVSDNRRPPLAQFLVLRSGNAVRRVRLGFIDWTQRKKKYYRILAAIKEKMVNKGEEPPLMLSPDELNLQGMTEEEKAAQREIWQKELAKVEEEIETLKSVLKSKVRLSQQLKKNLGFTVWRELSDDLSQGVKTVKETSIYQSVEGGLTSVGKAVTASPMYQSVEGKMSHVGKVVSDTPIYQRTESVVKMTAENTRSIIGGLTGGFTQKIGQIKSSESFRSFEDKVGSAYENVKTKVSSRSSSLQSFDDALREDSAFKNTASPTSPTIPEGKALP